MWPVRPYIIFPYYLIKAHFWKKTIIEHKMCVLFSIQILPEIFLVLRGTEQDIIKKCVLVLM